MVVDQRTNELGDEQVDRMFQALADATRRDIVVRVLDGEWSVSDLARQYPMSFAAVQKHVAVLERADLIVKERRGREQIVRTNIATVRRASELLGRIEMIWRGRMQQIDDLLAEPAITQITSPD
jgi:DNA-binding transcriptional ArsR family regulator